MIATGKPVVVVLTSGSAVAINSAAAGATAVLSAWYGGEEAGSAIADTLAGVNNPAGRLPVTFYKSLDQVPAFTDYSMKNRTYRYFKGEPLYPFGYGLSYSTFAYSDLNAKRTAGGAEVSATVKNTSSREGDEVVQLYIGGGADADAPIRNLRGFQRIHLKPGESRQVKFRLTAADVPAGEGGCERWRRAAHRQNADCEGFTVATGPKTRFRRKGFMRRGFIHAVVLRSSGRGHFRPPTLCTGTGTRCRVGAMPFPLVTAGSVEWSSAESPKSGSRSMKTPSGTARNATVSIRRLLFEGKVKEAETLQELRASATTNQEIPGESASACSVRYNDSL